VELNLEIKRLQTELAERQQGSEEKEMEKLTPTTPKQNQPTSSRRT